MNSANSVIRKETRGKWCVFVNANYQLFLENMQTDEMVEITDKFEKEPVTQPLLERALMIAPQLFYTRTDQSFTEFINE